jgi:hypothetical protein
VFQITDTGIGIAPEDIQAALTPFKQIWEQDADFLTELKADPEVRAHVADADLTAMFDLTYHTKNCRRDFQACLWHHLMSPFRGCFPRHDTSIMMSIPPLAPRFGRQTELLKGNFK